MTVEHAKELEDLERHVERVLDLIPWPGTPGVLRELRTSHQINAENRLRDLRAALGYLLGEINRNLRREPRLVHEDRAALLAGLALRSGARLQIEVQIAKAAPRV